jgi:hypothetical protein
MGGDHADIPTKRAKFGDALQLHIPADWSFGSLKDGRWWCSDAAKTITAYLGAEIIDLPAEASARAPSENVESYATEIVAFLRAAGFSRHIAIEPIQSGCVVHAVARYHDYEHPYRDYRWYTQSGRNDYVHRLRISLVVQMDAWDEQRLQPIVDHFAAEAFAFDPAVTFVDRPTRLSLKDHTLGGLFTWRIPDGWRWGVSAVGRQFYDLQDRPGRLLLAHRFIALQPEHTGGQVPGLARIIAEGRIAPRPPSAERRRIAATVIDAPLGAIGRIDDDEIEPPPEEELIDRLYVRHHQWFYVIVGEQQVFEIFFNLLVPLRKLGEDGIEQLVELVEREITALRLDPKLDF